MRGDGHHRWRHDLGRLNRALITGHRHSRPIARDEARRACDRRVSAHVVSVTRVVAVASLLANCACIAANPQWDRPNGSVVTGGDSEGSSQPMTSAPSHDDDSEEESDTSEGGTTTSTGGGGDDETAGPDDGTSGSTTTTPPPGCPPGEQLCGVECFDVDQEKHACGTACIDCTQLYGDNARCDHGECEAHEDGGGHEN